MKFLSLANATTSVNEIRYNNKFEKKKLLIHSNFPEKLNSFLRKLRFLSICFAIDLVVRLKHIPTSKSYVFFGLIFNVFNLMGVLFASYLFITVIFEFDQVHVHIVTVCRSYYVFFMQGKILIILRLIMFVFVYLL